MMDHTMTKNPDSIPHIVWPAETLRQAEKEAADSLGLTLFELMRRAGEAAFQLARSLYPASQHWLILCGHGNNGGDGFVMARVAAKEGVQVRVLLAEGEPKTADAKTNLARLAETAAEIVRDTEQAAFGADAVVDALYGTGFHGELRPDGAAACALMGRERERGAFVLALDLPSGVSADSGEVAEGAVQADATVTFDCTKPLHFAKASKPLCGALVCADIGIGKALGERET